MTKKACESFGLIVVNMRTPECIKDNFGDNLHYKLTQHVTYDEYGTGRLQNKNGEFKCGWRLPRPAELVKIVQGRKPLRPYRPAWGV